MKPEDMISYLLVHGCRGVECTDCPLFTTKDMAEEGLCDLMCNLAATDQEGEF